MKTSPLRLLPILALASWFGVAQVNAESLPVGSAGSIKAGPEQKFSRLENDAVAVTFDLSRGGAIAGIFRHGSPTNLVNVADEGRYIQQSYYAGHSLDRKADGQSPSWSPWSWNPIQVGDAFGHRSRVLITTNDQSTFYVKCVPMLWDMNNQPAEAEMEQWATLEGNVIHVRNRLTCHRTNDAYGEGVANSQELPAVYPISGLNRLFTYRGDKPFSNEPAENVKVINLASGFWGTYDNVSEHWMAFVNDHNWGMGIYNPQCTNFLAGLSGDPGRESTDKSTSYIAPIKQFALSKQSVFEYEYDVVIGTLDEIRANIYRLHGAARSK